MDDDVISVKIDDVYDLTNQMVDISTISSSIIDDTIYINDGNDWILSPAVVFENKLPNPYELREMCAEYPALEKAYENFKTIYKMVEQDWNGKQKERNNSAHF